MRRPTACTTELYALYRRLHDAFGGVSREADLGSVMKDLLAIRERQAARAAPGSAA